MASSEEALGTHPDGDILGLLAKERTVAGRDFNRWLVPPCALAIHLCIGMAYGFSVFWLPLSHAVGIASPVVCPAGTSLLQELFVTNCDWRISSLGWMYTLFFVFLGGSAAIWGGWLEHAGPRKAGFVAALCWCGGLALAALGIYAHQLWLMWLGAGVIGGIGLGLGYISPVSTLIKWFPDRRGMATGMAIMGFGGGAMIGAPLADMLMRRYATPTSVGVWETFLTLAVIYFVFMMSGAFGYRLPPPNWRPRNWTPDRSRTRMITARHVHVDAALKTPQFWLIWWVLCLNVTAGIGVIGMASPMLQEVFAGKLIGIEARFNELTLAQRGLIAATAAGFTGLLSLFNIGGRFAWASISDLIGRKLTYYTFFVLGIALYASVPWSGHAGHVALFVGAFCIILSMYGGGFSTVPAYLADMFGTQMVGAIHGRLLTAWSAAGIFGPVIVNYIREYQLAHGVPRAAVYDITMYVLCALLALGFLCNLLVRPVHDRHFMNDAQLKAETRLSRDDIADLNAAVGTNAARVRAGGGRLKLCLAWLAVGVPLAWGIWMTLSKAIVLFR